MLRMIAVLVTILQVGCSVVTEEEGYRCWLSQDEVEGYPILGHDPEPGLFRFKGVYMGGWEVSSLVVYWPDDIYSLSPYEPTSYCVVWLGPCYDNFGGKLAAPEEFSDRLSEFAVLEGLVAWKPRALVSDCLHGYVRIVGLSAIKTPERGESLESPNRCKKYGS